MRHIVRHYFVLCLRPKFRHQAGHDSAQVVAAHRVLHVAETMHLVSTQIASRPRREAVQRAFDRDAATRNIMLYVFDPVNGTS